MLRCSRMAPIFPFQMQPDPGSNVHVQVCNKTSSPKEKRRPFPARKPGLDHLEQGEEKLTSLATGTTLREGSKTALGTSGTSPRLILK